MADINGTPGDDTLIGTPGNDTINGLAGADGMYGGTGDDVYIFDNPGDYAIEAAGEGNDRAFTTVSYALTPGSEIELLSVLDNNSTNAIDLYGNELANQIWGNAGVNFLAGGGGNDALIGFGGADTMIGEAGADYLDGGDGDDALFGGDGNDTLIGGAGADYLDGGTGEDGMYGGAGDDTYFFDQAGDFAIEAAGGGHDRIFTTVSYALTPGSDIELLSAIDNNAATAMDLTGNELANDIWGNNGANVITGGGGNDALIAFGGADTVLAGAGNDYVDGGTGDDTLIGGDGNDFMGGGDGNDYLDGGIGDDVLVGGIGNDYMDGNTGADGMYGGAGDDTYLFDQAGDFAIETAGQGHDRAFTSVSYALTPGSEIELLSALDNNATNAMDLTGNELANEIWGNAGVNVLTGGGGNDTLLAFGGADTVLAGDGADYVDGGLGNDALFGGNGDDTLIGGDGNDYIDGGTGADGMYGGTGDDTYFVDSAGDFTVEAAGQGNDTVYTSVSFTLGAGSEVELVSAIDNNATTALDITGNELANQLYGNNGVNTLTGDAGNDVLIGFGGNDTLAGGTGNDYLDGGAGSDNFLFNTALGAANVDTVSGFTAGTDKIVLGGNGGEPFAILASGALAAGAFVIGTAAADANDYLIYNSATGALLYDADGNGAGAAVQFATLGTGLALTAADFTVSGPANHAPTISSGATATVAENTVATTIVYQTAATDSDGDRITYTLGGADAALLNIDANGAVRLNQPADFETKNSYSFTVTASDSGAGSTPKAVTLTITDVNELPPTPIINEVATPNDSIATAQVIDRNILAVSQNPNLPDQSLPSATIVGSISANADTDFFSIHLEKGEKLILDVDGTTNSLDSHIHVFDAAGNEIGDNDDQGDFDPGSSPPFDHNTDSLASFRAPASGTYYFSIESFDNSSNGNYQINVSIAPVATQAQIIEEDIEALLSGSMWNHTNLSYGFPTAAAQYPGSSFHEVQPATEFQAFNAGQISATQSLLQMIQNVTGLVFAQNSATPGSADIRYAMSTDPDVEVAYAYYPTNNGPTSVGGSAWFNTHDFNTPLRGNYAWMGILHETGHTLGLKHGHEMPAISPDRDSVEYSVMTYRSYPGAPLDGYVIEHWGYPQTLMMYDIAALQRMYGANFNFNSGDSVYSWNPNTGEMSINGVGQGAPGDNDGNSTASENRVLMTIWDGGGNDTYDLSAYTNATTIDLRPGEWTKTSQAQTSNLSASEGTTHFARGNVASALLYNGDTHSLIENAIGGSGADILIANQGANHLTGNGGADLFTWADTTGGGTGALADTIMDFVRGTDKIDLSAIDANPATQADDPFSFLGTAAFTNHAGEIRYDVTGGAAHVFVDFDGNGVADMEVIVNNNTILAGTDFVL